MNASATKTSVEVASLALLLCAGLDYDSVIVDTRPLGPEPGALADAWWDRYPSLMPIILGADADLDAVGWERVNAGVERLARQAQLLQTEGGPVPSSSGWAALFDAHAALVGGDASDGDWLASLKTSIEDRWGA